MENKQDYIELNIDTHRIMKTIWRRAWAILLSAVLCCTLYFCYAKYYVTPSYSASTLMYVNNSSFTVGSTSFSISSSELTAAQSLVDTYLVILMTEETLTEVIERANLPYTYEQLYGMISSGAVNGTEVFRITVTTHDPDEATLIANTIADTLPKRISDIVNGSSVKIVNFAVRPVVKSAPSYVRYLAIGFILGGIISCALLVMFEIMDDKIHDTDGLSFIRETPILAEIPNLNSTGSSYRYYEYGKKRSEYKKEKKKSRELKKDGVADKEKSEQNNESIIGSNLDFAATEAYKLLRANMMFSLPADGERKCKVVGVTSGVRGEGKTLTSINLSYVLAEAGKRVLLIDADLRLPSLAKRLSLHRSPGLSNILAGISDGNIYIQKSHLLESFDILTSGDIPPNPSELLGAKIMKRLIMVLEEKYDYIVVDLPPVNIVSDALVVSPLCDGMLVIVRQEYTGRSEAAKAIELLRYGKAKILGIVFNESSSNDKVYKSRYYGRRYKYGYKYGRGREYKYGYSRSNTAEENKTEKEQTK